MAELAGWCIPKSVRLDQKRPFREEYFEIPEKNEVQFKDEYVFEFFIGIDGRD